MRTFLGAASAAIISATLLCREASAAMTWDNGIATYNTSQFYTAERNTQSGPSWVVDDATLTTGSDGGLGSIKLMSFEWIGLRRDIAGVAGFGYDKADFSIWSPDQLNINSPLELRSNVNWTSVDMGKIGQNTLYKGTIDLSTLNIELTEGRFFFGARLVGNAANFLTGRNFMVSRAGGMNPEGESEAYLYNQPGGVNNFTGAGAIFGASTDFSWQITYEIVPEPASLGLLAVGGALAVMRRRS